ncbi:hypothetical protein QFC21_004744 [Naganishia friedmannii]|uniref:Uncharacterized protein n=1 Tax=Naganishia friedmannii TaxID=89922 RepID=A0ACC2VGG9_9TREE|nr:hypothetical protein QFC21_004744 [Naganishia friedmannii]
MSFAGNTLARTLRPCLRTARPFPAIRSANLSRFRSLSTAFASPYAQAAKSSFGRRMATVGLGAGFGLIGFQMMGLQAKGEVKCDSCELDVDLYDYQPCHLLTPARWQVASSTAAPAPSGKADALPTESILSPYELSFGAICGICAGIFIKKGAKLIAFFLGGTYVLMQYMQSRSFININWSKLSSAYENTFGSLPSTSSSLAPTEGRRVAPTITGAYRWIVDFLTANFQQRASFLAGLGLGLRIG